MKNYTAVNIYNAIDKDKTLTVYELEDGKCLLEDESTEESMGIFDSLEEVKKRYMVF